MTFAQCWCHYISSQKESASLSTYTQESMNLVFAKQEDEEAIYLRTTREIAETQRHDHTLNTMADKHGYTTQLLNNTKVVISTRLQQRAVAWYHHYLQHPGNTHLEETLCLLMYWKDLRKTVQS